MRVVYGAGAVAAVSIMAVGLVQPDWSSNADPSATDESWQPTDDPGAVAALPDGTPQGLPDPTAGTDNGGGKVRHVIHYVYLKPGQTAPPGATVIAASAPPPRVGNNRPGSPDPTATPRSNGGGNTGNNGGGNNAGGGNNGGGPVATPRPTPRPTQPPVATPPPTPKPTPKTHQSGHP